MAKTKTETKDKNKAKTKTKEKEKEPQWYVPVTFVLLGPEKRELTNAELAKVYAALAPVFVEHKIVAVNLTAEFSTLAD